jgi:hypothetical protein
MTLRGIYMTDLAMHFAVNNFALAPEIALIAKSEFDAFFGTKTD